MSYCFERPYSIYTPYIHPCFFSTQPAMDWDASYLAPHAHVAGHSGNVPGAPAAVGTGCTGSSRPVSLRQDSPRGGSNSTLGSGSLIGGSSDSLGGVSIGSKIGRSINQLIARRGSAGIASGPTSSAFGMQHSTGLRQLAMTLGHTSSLSLFAHDSNDTPSGRLSSIAAARSASPDQHRQGMPGLSGHASCGQIATGATAASGRACDARRAMSLPSTMLQGQRDQLERIKTELLRDKGGRTSSPPFLVS